MTGARAYAVRVGLGEVPAGEQELWRELAGRLDPLQPRLRRGDAGFELRLTVDAGDLWSAVLAAMAAVTSTGYAVERLDARPIPAASHRT